MSTLPDWAHAYGQPLCSCRVRTTPSDFLVTEQLDIDFSGDGEHDWLCIEKTGANTIWVASQLATHARVPSRDVGYSGLKDRHAITRQWFSVRRPSGEGSDWGALDIEGVELLEHQRHQRKLKRGTHRGNAFRIALRGEEIASVQAQLDERLEVISEQGVPNYFGEQRFGRDGGNVALGQAVLAGRRVSRNKRSIGISALRSLEFNNELSERVARDTWNEFLAGDTANLDGTNSIFAVDAVDAELERRCRELDIHPTGTLPALESIDVKASRRPLRVRVRDLTWEITDDALWLNFGLGSGSFATAVLRELALLQ